MPALRSLCGEHWKVSPGLLICREKARGVWDLGGVGVSVPLAKVTPNPTAAAWATLRSGLFLPLAGVERSTGETLQDRVQRRVINPLWWSPGITDTYHDVA